MNNETEIVLQDNDSFPFKKGDRYKCIMSDEHGWFTLNKVYHSEIDDSLTDNSGDAEFWSVVFVKEHLVKI